MNLSNLKSVEGSVKNRKRIGRGQGSGRGGTSTRGHKGAKSRSGYSSKRGFEGGQMPLHRRLPKFGFKNFNRIEYRGINLEIIQKLADSKGIVVINPDILNTNGLTTKSDRVKILGKGKLSTKLEISAHAFSKTAQEAIEKVGGIIIKL